MNAEELFEYVKVRFDADEEEVVIPISGRSMWPFLNPEVDKVALRRCTLPQPGQMVLARAETPRGIFLHRVEAVEPDVVRLKGDNNLRQREICRHEDVIAVAVAAIRRGKRRSLTTAMQLRVLPRLWRMALPLKSFLAQKLR